MARESVNVEELLRVNPQDILDSLSQENSRLRLENAALQSVVNKLTAAISEMSESSDEESDD